MKDILHDEILPFYLEAKKRSVPLSMEEKDNFKSVLRKRTKALSNNYDKWNVPFKTSGMSSDEQKNIELLKQKTNNLKQVVRSDYNPFGIEADKFFCDLLTDSGTSTLTDNQKQLLENWDCSVPSMYTYSYARPLPREQLNAVVQKFFGEQFNFFLTTQGRGSEFLLLNALVRNKTISSGDKVLSNRPFDTTKGHIQAVNLDVFACTPMTDPQRSLASETVFLGNLDLDVAKQKFDDKVKIMLITVTDNGGGGQPVSMKNFMEVVDFARMNNLILWVDACRVLENAFFIHLFDNDYDNKTILDIAKEMLSYADVVTVSFKKMYSHSGGGILINRNSEILQNQIDNFGLAIKELTTVVYGNGFDSYSGRTGRDMIEILSGLFEAINPKTIGDRIMQPYILAATLHEGYGLPLVAGGHAIYLAADQIMPKVELLNCPAEYLNAIIMASCWIRGCGLGNMVYGGRTNGKNPHFEHPVSMDSLRLAIPRKTYTSAYMLKLLSAVGIGFKNGIFENMKGGLEPLNYINDGFYHFKGHYKAKDEKEFNEAARELNSILRIELKKD
jgi:tryptophanase